MNLDLAIPIASASKALSATIILSLVNNGLIDLDTPVSQYIGDQINWPIIKRDITMRMLLNHTSGLPFDSPCLSEDDTTLKDCAQEIANTGDRKSTRLNPVTNAHLVCRLLLEKKKHTNN